MKCQFHFLFHVNNVGLQMYSDKFLNILSHEFETFLQIFVFKEDTGQFFWRNKSLNQPWRYNTNQEH